MAKVFLLTSGEEDEPKGSLLIIPLELTVFLSFDVSSPFLSGFIHGVNV